MLNIVACLWPLLLDYLGLRKCSRGRAGGARVVLTRDDGENVFIGGGRGREWREPLPLPANILLEDCGNRRNERARSMPAVPVAAFLLASEGNCAKGNRPKSYTSHKSFKEPCFRICQKAYLPTKCTSHRTTAPLSWAALHRITIKIPHLN